MSTFLTGAAAAAVVKSPGPSGCSSSSSPSSTLSETSPPRRISTTATTNTTNNKRARTRTPRKRPNQTYSEAAALLSAVYPNLFSPNKLCKHTTPLRSLTDSSSDLLPALGDAGLLTGQPPSEQPRFRIETPLIGVSSCRSSPSSQFCQPGSPGTLDDDGLDAESILDEETGEGIDSIMGNLSVTTNEVAINYNCNPFFRTLMGFTLGGELEFGLRRALRHVDDGERRSSPTLAVRDIIPKFRTLSSITSRENNNKKNKKKEKKEVVVVVVKKEETKILVKREMKELTSTAAAATTTTIQSMESLRSNLLLKLNYEEVAKDWSDRGSPFSGNGGAPESSGDILARLAGIVLSPEEASGGADGVREASVMRYKEKRRSRLFSKKIRYQVRKVNAERRPRMKGRFAKRTSLLQEAIEEARQ